VALHAGSPGRAAEFSTAANTPYQIATLHEYASYTVQRQTCRLVIMR
jgi:hypothetical protein